jgi:signal transduction histidine kinase
MEERIKRLGGTVTFRNNPLGFEIVAVIPELNGRMKYL